MHHLNREEYNNTIRDLTGMDLRPGDAFPNDDVGYGFDNNGDVLSISPLLLEKYLNAAESVSQAVVVTPEMMRRPTVIAATTFATEGSATPARDGLQLDSTGSTALLDREFASNGDYILPRHGLRAAGRPRSRPHGLYAGQCGSKNGGCACQAEQSRNV